MQNGLAGSHLTNAFCEWSVVNGEGRLSYSPLTTHYSRYIKFIYEATGIFIEWVSDKTILYQIAVRKAIVRRHYHLSTTIYHLDRAITFGTTHNSTKSGVIFLPLLLLF